MSVKLRLTRVGKTKQPQYRIVAADSRSPRDGRFIEIIGQYNPRQEPSAITVDNAKVVKWLMDGAQPTERVRKLLEISGAWGEFDAARAGAIDGIVVLSGLRLERRDLQRRRRHGQYSASGQYGPEPEHGYHGDFDR